MTGVDKVALVRQIEGIASEPPSNSRDEQLSELIVDLIDLEPGPALLVLWDRLPVERDLAAARSISFAMARHGEHIGVVGCPVLSSFLASPVISEPATLLNTIAAVGLVDPSNPVQVGVLQSDLGGFVVRCLGRPELPVDVLIGLLLRLADLELLARVFSKSQLATIAARLDAAVAPVESSLVRSDWEALKAELRGDFQEVVRIDRTAIDAALVSQYAWPDAAGWGDFLPAAVQSGVAALQDILLLEELSAEASGTTTAVHQLHLIGARTEGRRLAIGPYGRLLVAWRRLFETAFGVLDATAEGPHGPPPAMFVLAPQPSSFVIRVTVDAGGRDDLAARAFARAAEAIQRGDAGDTEGARRDGLANSVEAVYSVLDSNQLDLSISMETPRAQLVRARTRVTHTAAARAIGVPRRTTGLPREAQVVVGTLEAANHRTGQVEIGLESQQAVRCEIQQNRRGDLLNRVIGRRYSFSIEPQPDDEQPPWLLLSMAVEETEATDETEFVVTASGDKLMSELVPQQDRLDRVTQVVRLIAAARPVTPGNMKMPDTPSSVRHIGYMKHAAKILRLISKAGALLPAGRTLVTLAKHRTLPFLALQFETAPVGRAWLKWANARDVTGLEPATAVAFLRERSVLSESMVERRGRTLRRWIEAFQAGTYTSESADED